ncbi:Guanine nucleotide-binding protein alpha-2 subunit [Mycena kentingensis (nom. inval.)]|nr:Guanine nucleotide-binding protein alpha-2 subunit [Mycena kentingensis (nom. inval.)]
MAYLYHRQALKLLRSLGPQHTYTSADVQLLSTYLRYPYTSADTKNTILVYLSWGLVANEESHAAIVDSLVRTDLLVELMDSPAHEGACELVSILSPALQHYEAHNAYWSKYRGFDNDVLGEDGAARIISAIHRLSAARESPDDVPDAATQRMLLTALVDLTTRVHNPSILDFALHLLRDAVIKRRPYIASVLERLPSLVLTLTALRAFSFPVFNPPGSPARIMVDTLFPMHSVAFKAHASLVEGLFTQFNCIVHRQRGWMHAIRSLLVLSAVLHWQETDQDVSFRIARLQERLDDQPSEDEAEEARRLLITAVIAQPAWIDGMVRNLGRWRKSTGVALRSILLWVSNHPSLCDGFLQHGVRSIIGLASSEDHERQAWAAKVLSNVQHNARRELPPAILLLGSPESGKYTIATELGIITDPNYPSADSDAERQRWRDRDVIHRHAIDCIRYVVEQVQDPGTFFPTTSLQRDAQVITNLELGDGKLAVPALRRQLQACRRLWDHLPLRDVMRGASSPSEDDTKHVAYFTANMERILSRKYVPAHADLLRCTSARYNLKNAPEETTIRLNGRNATLITIANVSKCMDQFQRATAIIFIVDISEYDGHYTENKVEDGLERWSLLCKSGWFANTDMIIIFNKYDIFVAKIKILPINRRFLDFGGTPSNATAATDYFIQKFMDVHRRWMALTTPKATSQVFVHFTNALEGETLLPVIKTIEQ